MYMCNVIDLMQILMGRFSPLGEGKNIAGFLRHYTGRKLLVFAIKTFYITMTKPLMPTEWARSLLDRKCHVHMK